MYDYQISTPGHAYNIEPTPEGMAVQGAFTVPTKLGLVIGSAIGGPAGAAVGGALGAAVGLCMACHVASGLRH